MESSHLAKNKEPPDQDLAGSATVSEGDAFARMVEDQEKRVFGFFYRRISDKNGADDLTQDVFKKAWDNRGKFDSSRPAWPWLKKIAQNALISSNRKDSTLKRNPTGKAHSNSAVRRHGLATLTGHVSLDPSPEPCEVANARERSQIIQSALEELSNEDYSLVTQRYFDDKTPTEIAAISGKSPQAVHSALNRAREKIKALLQKRVLQIPEIKQVPPKKEE